MVKQLRTLFISLRIGRAFATVPKSFERRFNHLKMIGLVGVRKAVAYTQLKLPTKERLRYTCSQYRQKKNMS